MKILVADDDRASVCLLKGNLTRWGYDVVTAHDGVEAMAIFDGSDPPRLGIIDWMMPGMDGLELIRQIRLRTSRSYAYLVLLTGKVRRQDMLEGMEAGADDYLTKPLDNRELKARLRAAERILQLEGDLIAARESLREQATRDALTGLLNRAAILDTLTGEIARATREDKSISVIMADIDHFKRVNDTHGHEAGDIVLRQVADRFRNTMRPYDLVGRYGGEEFVIVVPCCDATFASCVAERFRAKVADEPFDTGDAELTITVSMGVASVRSSGDVTCDALMRAADVALYESKNNGRNRVTQASAQGMLAAMA